jgi:hypothetical protein
MSKKDYGKLNPNAPPELSRFAFLIGEFHCDAKLKRPDGTVESFKATWEGRFILDGYVIADDYRMTAATGELLVLGTNFRLYDRETGMWNLKWINALAGTWVDLGPEELGGVKIDEKEISYCLKETASPGFTRSVYTNISANRFTWRGEKSEDLQTWEEYMLIEAHRSTD